MQQRISTAATNEAFTPAYIELQRLYATLIDIRSLEYGPRGYGAKMENLSLFSDRSGYQFDRTSDAKIIYGRETRAQSDNPVAWNNLVKIAEEGEDAQNLVVATLSENGIHDYRITHDLPYVKIHNQHCYKIDENGILSKEKVPEYELDYALDSERVLAAYDYVRTYLDGEDAYVEQLAANVLSVTEDGFKGRTHFSHSMSEKSMGLEWTYELISVFNALPNPDEDYSGYKSRNVLYAIPNIYRRKHTIPGTNEDKRFGLNEDLFDYANPIFQENFGDDLKEVVKARKQRHQQKLFEVSFEVMQNIGDIWLSVSQQHEEAEQECKKYRDARGKADFTDAEEEEYRKLSNKAELFRTKEDDLSSLIHNFAFSIFKQEGSEYNLQRLTEEQRIKIAQLVTHDEKNIYRKVFPLNRYEQFFDFLNILPEQIKRFNAGNYEFTPMMAVVANNLGYQTANNRAAVESNISADTKDDYSRCKYIRFLTAFDLTRYLSNNSDIDLSLMAKAYRRIEMEKPDGFRNETDEYKAFYASYESMMTSDRFLSSITQVFERKTNHDDLSFDENIDSTDNLVWFRKQMGGFLEKKEKEESWIHEPYYETTEIRKRVKKVKKSLKSSFDRAVRGLGFLTPEERLEKRNQEFLNSFDEGIYSILGRAEAQILEMNNPLDKIKKLHWFYKHTERSYSSDPHRTKALQDFDDKEGSLQKISDLSEVDDFWPDDPFEHIQAFIFARQTFIDDVALENTLLNKILDKVEALPASKAKNDCLYLLLDKELRASYPETRDRLFDIYTQDIFAKLGYDDGSEQYQNRLAVFLKSIEGGKEDSDYSYSSENKPAEYDDFIIRKMSSADKYVLLRQVSDKILSQEKTSYMFKKACQVSLDASYLQRSYLYGIGIDTLTSDLDRNPETANQFIKFLNSKGEMTDCDAISAHMQQNIREREGMETHRNKDYLESELEKVSPIRCKLLYDNFWAAPLEARAVITARVLKSAASSKDNQQENSWEATFDVVMHNLIPADESVEAKYAQDIMHSYIKSRSDYERELILSAMMVANRNIGEDVGNIGKALKLFLENMGPAEIKLGQAIASHPNTPSSIRQELQELKNSADLPARWTIYDWIKNEKIPEEYWKDKHLGETLGSASYYTTVALGGDEVLRILRPEAREKATKGFRVIEETVVDLQQKDAVSDLDYRELTSSVQEMVKQAARMSHIETDHDIGQQQYEYTQEIYNGVTIHSGAETFHLKVMDWNAKGKNWMKLKRAKGYLFNDLPENSPEQSTYKGQFAKGYITFELSNILSGKKFDHDKHGAQLCINPETNEVGIFDTGAMALNEPTEYDQRLLGNVIYDVIKTSMTGDQSFAAFSSAITSKIDELHSKEIDTQYLVEVKKGILALGDFFNVLDEDDIQEIMPGMEMLSQLSDAIQQGIYEKMSVGEKAQLKVFSATRAFTGNRSVNIHRNGKPIIVNDVANFNSSGVRPDKSSWLSDAFEGDDAAGLFTANGSHNTSKNSLHLH